MARNAGTLLANNFSRGLVTEATGLNFPENAVTESLNVEFQKIGSVNRRKGYDVEGDPLVAEFWGGGMDDGVVKEFIWHTVGKHGGFTFLVVQSGAAIRFWNLSDEESVSSGFHHAALYLEQWKKVGAPTTNSIPCSFSSGSGYLFITHPSIDPVVVRYEEDFDQLAATSVQIFVRDTEGVDDGLPVDHEPEEITYPHLYNLYNQGWFKYVRIGSVNNELGEDNYRSSTPIGSLTFWNIGTIEEEGDEE